MGVCHTVPSVSCLEGLLHEFLEQVSIFCYFNFFPFAFKSLIHLEFILILGGRWGSSFIFYQMASQLSQYHLLNNPLLPTEFKCRLHHILNRGGVEEGFCTHFLSFRASIRGLRQSSWAGGEPVIQPERNLRQDQWISWAGGGGVQGKGLCWEGLSRNRTSSLSTVDTEGV
jgi:hypothetical protein